MQERIYGMKIIKTIMTIITLLFSITFIVFSDKIAECIINSIYLCINVIIPSMFTFMLISTYIISSGIYKQIFHPLYLIFRNIVKLDEELFSIFCLSLIGGYPIGIKLLNENISQNKNFHEIYNKTLIFCYCISPTFAITMIGFGLYKSFEVGLIIYLSNVISCTITAIIATNRFNLHTKLKEKTKRYGLIETVKSTSSSLLVICTIIVTFNIGITAIEELISAIGLSLPVQLKAFLEISNILKLKEANLASLPHISARASTGGVCVFFQCLSIAGDKIKFKYFLFGRIIIAILSFIITKLILNIFNIYIPVSSSDMTFCFEFNTQRVLLVLLMLMSIFLMKKSEKKFKKG